MMGFFDKLSFPLRGSLFNTAILISVYPRFGGVFVLRQIM